MNWKCLTQTARFTLIAAGAVVGLACVSAPALAQDDDEIIVTAPYEAHHYTTGRTSSGMPIETTTLSRAVSTRDLDLRNDADVAALRRRIVYTARSTCEELNDISFDVSLTTDRECVHQAVHDAMPQARELIDRARY